MEHEVFVPVTAEALRQTLRDPARVARCVPGLQQDAEESAGPLSGRLKVRIGGHTITYRGALTLAERDGAFEVEGGGAEVRGTGSAKLTLTVRLAEATGGTTLAFTGGSRAEGRLAELPDEATVAAAHRLLDRLAARLGEESAPPEPSEVPEPPAPADPQAHTTDTPAPADADADAAADTAAPVEPDVDDVPAFDVDVTPAALDGETASGEGDFLIPDEPPAEAAHARRTMIGRSAEEVDHAPPRGRYAPVPAPESASAGATLRWVAPAAALALASAVVVGRVLRRRK
ncbi:SRPBCC domain-containing protein [Streptomyces sp. NPDC058405]|uniref:SRPBCC domain-containing protein n=1 Tax=Streptomyces sp. NPDC058405 TaxID=3346482 RepID=UPI0036526102